jgi:hypothetical protein
MSKQWIYRNGNKPFGVTEIKKPRTNDFWIIAVDEDSYITHHSKNGLRLNVIGHDPFDLIPYEPYSDYKINDEVYGRDDERDEGKNAHFARLSDDGRPQTFPGGLTSFTYRPLNCGLVTWNFCEKADKGDK